MNFMEATEKNAETVNEIIKILVKKEYTIQEAHSILDHIKRRIEYTSKVEESTLTFSCSE